METNCQQSNLQLQAQLIDDLPSGPLVLHIDSRDGPRHLTHSLISLDVVNLTYIPILMQIVPKHMVSSTSPTLKCFSWILGSLGLSPINMGGFVTTSDGFLC